MLHTIKQTYIWPHGGAAVTLLTDPSTDIKQNINLFYPCFTALNQLVSPSGFLGPRSPQPLPKGFAC